MKLKVLSLYRSGAVRYETGATIDVRDDEGELLLRDSPGSFRIVAPATVEAFVEAHSTPTDTGLTAPDRKLRGGKRRKGPTA